MFIKKFAQKGEERTIVMDYDEEEIKQRGTYIITSPQIEMLHHYFFTSQLSSEVSIPA